MAEAPEHPTGVREPAPAPAAGVGPGRPGWEAPEPYRPLSLLAVAGFALAVVYAAAVTVGGLAIFVARYRAPALVLLVFVPLCAVVVGVVRRQTDRLGAFVGLALAGAATVIGLGSLVAFSGSNPWLLPGFMWLVAVAALVVSWLARARIAASEDTLSGAALARWGIGLSLFFGVNYAAYQASTTLAVRSQARQCADDFLDEIKKGDLLQAYVLTLPPAKRPQPGPGLRRQIEILHNTSRGGIEGGPFFRFTQTDVVRLIQLAGDQGKLEPTTAAPHFEQGVYGVLVQYLLTTPQGTFEIGVQTLGSESAEGRGRREWHVEPRATTLLRVVEQTEKGRAMEALTAQAGQLARHWSALLAQHNAEAAYFDTVPGDQREKQLRWFSKTWPAMGGAAGPGLAAVAAQSPDGASYRRQRQAFADGRLLDTEGYWAADDALRKDTLDEVRQVFSGKTQVPISMELEPARFPLVTEGKDKTLVRLSCHLLIRDVTGPYKYRVDGEVVVEMAHVKRPTPESGHVVSLRLLRGQTLKEQKPGDRR
jgi:hypothetical protein